MSTDRELLELAAKAAGYWCSEFNCPADLPRPGWDPLADDGDALRLAVKLGIEVHPDQETKEVTTAFMVQHHVGLNTFEEFGSDEMAATRRAIVRAAAQMRRAL